MREYAAPVLKWVCLILAALVLYELAGMFRRVNPLHGVRVPALPALATNRVHSPAAGFKTNSQPVSTAGKSTNAAPNPAKTNLAAAALMTNQIAGSNVISIRKSAETNSVAPMKIEKMKTNFVAGLETKTNGTNQVASPKSMAIQTNLLRAGTNLVSHSNLQMAVAGHVSPPGMAGMNFHSFSPAGKPADLPAAIQDQIKKITASEILGPVIHPLPMALLGIAGDDAFLRSPGGQTGLVKVGDSLGEIKLLRIGINRVLVEQDGQQKELTIFSGYGGESLLSKPGDTNNEIHNP